MPILDVQIVRTQKDPAGLAQRLADAAGDALASRPRGTWVRLHFLEAHNYGENGGAEPRVAPVFVTVLQAEVPKGAVLEAMANQLTAAIADVCKRPAEHVHVVFEPNAKGRVAFGGRLQS